MSEKVLHEWTTENGNRFSVLKNGNMGLGLDRGRMALSGWEPAFSREIARLAAENAKLRAFVRAADAIKNPKFLGDDWMVKKRWHEALDAYDAARAEVKP